LADYERDGFGAWGIEHRTDQRLIGIINFNRPHPINRRVEVGYTIARAYWGQGYATEAVKELIKFGVKSHATFSCMRWSTQSRDWISDIALFSGQMDAS
jgi:RimJ/RimL family protein N-acetyltransferase